MKDQLHSHIARGGDVAEASYITGRKETILESVCKFSFFQADSKDAIRVQSGQSVQITGATHPPKVKYYYDHNNHYCSSHSRTTTPSQSEI